MRNRRQTLREFVALIVAGALAIIAVLKNADTIDGPTTPAAQVCKQ